MIKNYKEFQNMLSEDTPPADWPEALIALWYDAKGNWEAAHDIAQELHTSLGSWAHAYLHRKEGDDFNAGYWYRQAGRPFFDGSLNDEHREMVEFVLKS
ncbi:hypothetical protein FGM00_09145 [Aggregatimonas sangjinii]|uniref:Uncharacterized protein n=1 Tax=Aggregatimonas sangjinii TaxID=2583587 RepID=A0A5B7STF3_9FLAO|nr:hypothetical protein [Aggregatimonas sangjinii]QCX00268.1 hypothetical protein FGM00_09145 [Aggregatimonas sangjinii]